MRGDNVTMWRGYLCDTVFTVLLQEGNPVTQFEDFFSILLNLLRWKIWPPGGRGVGEEGQFFLGSI